MAENPIYTVEVRKGWSYVIGPTTPKDSGPWRYEWEAQEYANELNRPGDHGKDRA